MGNLKKLIEEKIVTLRLNPISQTYGVILHLDRLPDALKNEVYKVNINEVEYELTKNRFNSSIRDVTLKDRKVSEKIIKEGYLV